MSPPKARRRTRNWPHGKQIVEKQHISGSLAGACCIETAHPLDSCVCGSGGKQYIKGKAMGDPQHQMAAAMDSANGEKHSSASAVAEKTESRGPQPCVQKSGHASIITWTGLLRRNRPMSVTVFGTTCCYFIASKDLATPSLWRRHFGREWNEQ